MSSPLRPPAHSRAARAATSTATVAVATALALIASPAYAALGTPVPLGAASSFSVLGGDGGVTNTGATTLSGDIGSFDDPSITGLDTINLGGANHAGDDVTQQAKRDLETAYGNALAQTPDKLDGVELGDRVLKPGVYHTGGVLALTGNLTLDADGDPDAVFIFHSPSALLASTGSSITFIDGATACHLYWQVESSATIEAGSRFAGTILARTSITLGSAATLEGRALALVGKVTLDNNTITMPVCSDGTTDDGDGDGTDPGDGDGTTPGDGTPPDDGEDDGTTPGDGNPPTESDGTTPTDGEDTTPDATPPPGDTPSSPPDGTPTTTPIDTAPQTTPVTSTPGDTSLTGTPVTWWPEGFTPSTAPYAISTGGSPQVGVVPRGGVATGDGSSLAGTRGIGGTGVATTLALLAAVWFARARRAGHEA